MCLVSLRDREYEKRKQKDTLIFSGAFHNSWGWPYFSWELGNQFFSHVDKQKIIYLSNLCPVLLDTGT